MRQDDPIDAGGAPQLPPFVVSHLADVARLCRKHRVRNLEIFGSATSDNFDPERSDIDFIVDFGPGAEAMLFMHYFDLKQGLEAIFARRVDLVMAGAMRNPHFVADAKRSRRKVYASPVAEAA